MDSTPNECEFVSFEFEQNEMKFHAVVLKYYGSRCIEQIKNMDSVVSNHLMTNVISVVQCTIIPIILYIWAFLRKYSYQFHFIINIFVDPSLMAG